MKTIKLYYPAFVEIDGEPEKMNFETPEDWKADEAIYRRMYKDDGTLEDNIVVYKAIEPNRLGGRYYLELFEKLPTGAHYCVAILITDTLEEMKDTVDQLHVRIVPEDKW